MPGPKTEALVRDRARSFLVWACTGGATFVAGAVFGESWVSFGFALGWVVAYALHGGAWWRPALLVIAAGMTLGLLAQAAGLVDLGSPWGIPCGLALTGSHWVFDPLHRLPVQFIAAYTGLLSLCARVRDGVDEEQRRGIQNGPWQRYSAELDRFLEEGRRRSEEEIQRLVREMPDHRLTAEEDKPA
jgi:hypothetical protein